MTYLFALSPIREPVTMLNIKKLRVQIQNCRDMLVAIEKPETAKDDAKNIELGEVTNFSIGR